MELIDVKTIEQPTSYDGIEQSGHIWGRRLVTAVLAVFALVAGYVLIAGPRLAINHDESNFLQEALRLLSQRRLQSYAHAPLMYELIAINEAIWFVIARLLGQVTTQTEYLTMVIAGMGTHIRVHRAVTALAACGVLLQLYNIGRLFSGRFSGALAALLCATNLTFWTFTAVCKEDTLFWFFLLTGCYQAWIAAERGQRRAALFAGFAIGAAFATKVFGLFGMMLCLLPFLHKAQRSGRESFLLAITILVGGVISTLLLYPFLLTDTTKVIDDVLRLGTAATRVPVPGLAFVPYFFTHLPNLVGWPVLGFSLVELILRLKNDPRGLVLLLAPAFVLFVFLGARPGFTMAYYIFPLALFLFVLASSLVWRVANMAVKKQAPIVALGAIGVICIADPAYLRGAIKHNLILVSQDVRLLARESIESRVPSGSRILITNSILGENFWGPPLLPQDLPGGTGAYAVALREVLDRAQGPRFQLQLLDGDVARSRDELNNTDVIVTPRFLHSHVELGPMPAPFTPPAQFRKTMEIEAVPERGFFFPYHTNADYEQLRRLSLAELWRDRRLGWTVIVYER